MLTSEFDYELPDQFIAQRPAEPRDSSKLMLVDRGQKKYSHHVFSEIEDILKPGDVLVWNDSKVFKARLRGKLELDKNSDGLPDDIKTSGKILNSSPVEIFLVRPMENKFVWKALAKPGRRLRLGMKVEFAPDFVGEVMLKEKDGTILIQFEDDDAVVRAKANQYGEVPTPPYVTKEITKGDEGLENRYQTVYARNEGSVAAPTAGFHFTPELIERLRNKGVEFAEVTLHVGLGTFLPVKAEKLEDHVMHSEWVQITSKNVDIINRAKSEKRRVIAIGTTTTRTLEGVAALNEGSLRSFSGDINIFISPGYKFNVIDCLITNFHLPKSTLLMLVSGFVGDKDFALQCYEEAKKNNYRFYSFGDAMFIE